MSAAPVLTLYAWGNELDRVEELLYEGEGELTPELEQALEEVTLGFKEKAERVALFVRNLQATAKAVKEEEERLRARRKSHENAAASLKTYLESQMLVHQIPRIEGKLVTLRIQKNPPAVHADALTQDELRLIVDEYVRVIPETRVLNKEAVIAHWKLTGESPIEGVVVSQGASLRLQ